MKAYSGKPQKVAVDFMIIFFIIY